MLLVPLGRNRQREKKKADKQLTTELKAAMDPGSSCDQPEPSKKHSKKTEKDQDADQPPPSKKHSKKTESAVWEFRFPFFFASTGLFTAEDLEVGAWLPRLS